MGGEPEAPDERKPEFRVVQLIRDLIVMQREHMR